MAGHTSYADHKDDLLSRLRKMEGQVRGLQRMIEDDRYCLDVVQQISALNAAAREVSMLVIEDHLKGCVADAVRHDNGDAVIKEMMHVLRRTVRP
jgi:DNA-binding FrmR family transcriptional regulator